MIHLSHMLKMFVFVTVLGNYIDVMTFYNLKNCHAVYCFV